MFLAVLAVSLLEVTSRPVSAQTAPTLGTTESFAVLAGASVTNTGPSVITGDLGVSPGTAITGFPPGLVIGATHSVGAVPLQAQNDATTVYNGLAGQPCDEDLTDQDLGDLELTTNVYCFSTSAQLTGTLTLDAENVPNAIFIFQIGSTLTTASASSVSLINGASPCNVYWQVGSSATLGTDTSFVGSIYALTSITLDTGVDILGRAVARNGSVTLDTNTITRPLCESATPTPTASSTASPTVIPTESPTVTPTESPTVTPTESPTVIPTESPTVTPTESPTATPTESPTFGGAAPTATVPSAIAAAVDAIAAGVGQPTTGSPAPAAPADTAAPASPDAASAAPGSGPADSNGPGAGPGSGAPAPGNVGAGPGAGAANSTGVAGGPGSTGARPTGGDTTAPGGSTTTGVPSSAGAGGTTSTVPRPPSTGNAGFAGGSSGTAAVWLLSLATVALVLGARRIVSDRPMR